MNVLMRAAILLLTLSVGLSSAAPKNSDKFDYKKNTKDRKEKLDKLLKHVKSNRALNLTQLQYIDFGVLPSNVRRCVMKVDQTLVGDCSGSGTLGEMEVNGEPFLAYAVNVASIGWDNGKLLRPKLVKQNYALDGNGKDKIFVRGVVQFRPNFNESGVLTLNYRITVFYQ